MARIYVIHENDAWVEPLRREFEAAGLPYAEWFLDGTGSTDFDLPPPEGVFYNRMSASSFTRDHRYAPEQTAAVLAWLERHGRRVANNSRALQLEISKVAQYAALQTAGIATPRTIAAVGRKAIAEAASAFAPGPVILKPNRGGKGHGVQLFQTVEGLRAHLDDPAYEAPVDGVSLLQQYIAAPEPFITRAEFIGGKFFYAVQVDTRQGFELCPADVCATGDAFCPTGEAAAAAATPRFRIVDGIEAELIRQYEAFLAANGIEVAGIEFVRDRSGRPYTYDVNTNTNYNADAEVGSAKRGMNGIAQFLGAELRRLYPEEKLRRRAAG
jgi:hypothetical protein